MIQMFIQVFFFKSFCKYYFIIIKIIILGFNNTNVLPIMCSSSGRAFNI